MNVYFLQVSAEPRYWEDTTINGQPDEIGSRVPFRHEDLWEPKIRLWDGVVMDWPKGTTAEIHYKVCDQGQYFLCNENGEKVAQYRGHYVPNEFLCHDAEGFGDYIIFNVDRNGKIQGYQRPDIDPDSWKATVCRADSFTIAKLED